MGEVSEKTPRTQEVLERALGELYQNPMSVEWDKKTTYSNLYSMQLGLFRENSRLLLFKDSSGAFIGAFIGAHHEYEAFLAEPRSRVLDRKASSFKSKNLQELKLNTNIPVDNLSCMGLAGNLDNEVIDSELPVISQQEIDSIANQILANENADGFFADRHGRLAFFFDRQAQAIVSVSDIGQGCLFQGSADKLESYFSSQLSRVASARKNLILGSGLQGLVDEFQRQRGGDVPKVMSLFNAETKIFFVHSNSPIVPKSCLEEGMRLPA